MIKPLLALCSVGKHFGPVKAVDGIDLEFSENRFYALLGASGSGKTTLLRLIAGFETPTNGRILLDGKDITGLPPNRRPVNLMFQSYALFPHMSVARNVAYGLEMDRLPKSEIRTRVNEMLGSVQLERLSDRKPDQLSGGQRQRVALARALVKRPRVLLLDEPLGALDRKLRGEMQLELKRIQDRFGITFIVVTHDQEEALVMADSIAVLKDGTLLQWGSPHEIYEHPANRYAAEFIGEMNFLPASAEDGILKARDGSRLYADTPPNQADCIVAVRPERMKLGASGGNNSLAGRLLAKAYFGQDLQLHLASPLSDKPVLVRVTADAADGQILSIGDTVAVSWADRDTRVFVD